MDETFDANVTITGNLQVDGTTTHGKPATLSVADNEITLNSDVTGTIAPNAGIEVERGSLTNVRPDGTKAQINGNLQMTVAHTVTSTYSNFSVTSNSASGNGALTYNNPGTFTFTPPDTSLATKSTTNLAEGTNLYYTNARADAQ